ncbi:MAG: hypothetical protein WC269_03980 [Candidatus Gracilibacteria bacterium]|jgi:hypothetical protein
MQPTTEESGLDAISRYGTENPNETFLRQTNTLHDMALLARLQDPKMGQKIETILSSAETTGDSNLAEIADELRCRIAKIIENSAAIKEAWEKRQPRGDAFYTRDYATVGSLKGKPKTVEELDRRTQEITGGHSPKSEKDMEALAKWFSGEAA